MVLEVGIEVATRARGAGGGRLQAIKLVASVQDEVAQSKNGRMTPHATSRLVSSLLRLQGLVVFLFLGFLSPAMVV